MTTHLQQYSSPGWNLPAVLRAPPLSYVYISQTALCAAGCNSASLPPHTQANRGVGGQFMFVTTGLYRRGGILERGGESGRAIT